MFEIMSSLLKWALALFIFTLALRTEASTEKIVDTANNHWRMLDEWLREDPDLAKLRRDIVLRGAALTSWMDMCEEKWSGNETAIAYCFTEDMQGSPLVVYRAIRDVDGWSSEFRNAVSQQLLKTHTAPQAYLRPEY